MGQILECLFWLPHTVQWIRLCWDRLVETRTLMRYGSANVKKCHFLAAGATLLKPSVVLEDTYARTHVLPSPKVFNLSLKAGWDRTANPSLSLNDKHYPFQQVPAATGNVDDQHCLDDMKVMYSGAATSEENTHSSIIDIKFPKSGLLLLEAWHRRLGYLRRDGKCIGSALHRRQRSSRYNPTATSKGMMLLGLQQTLCMSSVQICQVSNRIFMIIPP